MSGGRRRKERPSGHRKDWSGLTEYFKEQAEWRASKAEEYPEDGRNERASAGLLELAEYVEGLPDEDARLVTLALLPSEEMALFDPSDGRFFRPIGHEIPPACDRAATHFRFDVDESCADFFTRFCKLVAEEHWQDTTDEHGKN